MLHRQDVKRVQYDTTMPPTVSLVDLNMSEVFSTSSLFNMARSCLPLLLLQPDRIGIPVLADYRQPQKANLQTTQSICNVTSATLRCMLAASTAGQTSAAPCQT